MGVDRKGRWLRPLTVAVAIGVTAGWLGMPGEPIVVGLAAGAGVGVAVGLLAGAVSRRWG